MTATHGVGTYGNAAGTVTPLDHKMAQLGLFVKTAANTIRAGLLWDGSATIVSGKANMSYDVRAFTAVLSRGATAGAVILSNDGTYNVATTAAPGSNSRYDVVYVWQREYSLDGTDSNPVIGVVQGTAAASPSVPSLSAYPGAIELARILVPSGVTATNSGTTITQTAPFTATSGGIVPVRTTTERDAGSWVESQRVYDIATDIIWTYDGSTWNAPAGSFVGRAVRSSSTPTVSNAAYTDLSTTANWSTTSTAGMVKNFAAYSDGWTIPQSGVYEISYNLISVANIALVAGVTVNKATSVATSDLKLPTTAGAVQSVVAMAATGQVYLAASDVVRLFALAASGTPALTASIGQFTISWVRAA